MRVCTCMHACSCVCVSHGVAPQTEVRRSLEQVQIELNLIPHCAGTGMKLHNCTLIDNRTPQIATTPTPPPFYFSCSRSLFVSSAPKFLTWADGHDCLLVSLLNRPPPFFSPCLFFCFRWKHLIMSAGAIRRLMRLG